MSKDGSLVFHMSQEEIQYLLGMLGIIALPGFNPKFLEGISEREATIAMMVAERALIARGFLQPLNDGALRMDETPAVVLSSMAKPSFYFIVYETNPEAAREIVWAVKPGFNVEQRYAYPGIYTFTVSRHVESMKSRLMDFAGGISHIAPDYPNGDITEESFAESIQLAANQSEVERVTGALKEGGLEKATAEGLSKALCNSEKMMQFRFLTHSEETGNKVLVTLILIKSDEADFLLEKTDNKEEYKVQPISDRSLQKHLLEHFNSLAESLDENH